MVRSVSTESLPSEAKSRDIYGWYGALAGNPEAELFVDDLDWEVAVEAQLEKIQKRRKNQALPYVRKGQRLI